MLHIIGIILKIIGILLLILLSLIILILIAPISYRITVSKYEDIKANGKISWLFHILTGTFSYREGEFTAVFRIFGRKFPSSKPKKTKKDKSRPTKEEKEPDTSEVLLPAQKEDKSLDSVDYEQVQSAKNALMKEDEEDIAKVLTDRETDKLEEKETSINHTKEFPQKNKKTRKFFKQKEKRTTFKADKSDLKETGKMILEFLRKPEVVEFLQQIWHKFKHLLKHLLPHKVSASIHFGFSDPSYTGQFLGMLCMFYAYFYKNVNLEPDFEKEILEGKVFIKSRIITGYLLILLLKIAYYIFKNKKIIEEWNAVRLGRNQ